MYCTTYVPTNTDHVANLVSSLGTIPLLSVSAPAWTDRVTQTVEMAAVGEVDCAAECVLAMG